MTQRDLQRAIFNTYGIKIGDDRISRMVNGVLKNVQLSTAKLIADTLNVTIDDIVEL
jgi:DNA-binding Xre family transcriptional regulator